MILSGWVKTDLLISQLSRKPRSGFWKKWQIWKANGVYWFYALLMLSKQQFCGKSRLNRMNLLFLFYPDRILLTFPQNHHQQDLKMLLGHTEGLTRCWKVKNNRI